MDIRPSEGGWHHFYFPLRTFDHQDNRVPYEMVVLRRQGVLYFFTHCVAWCLGHANPRKAVEEHVPSVNLYTLSGVGGQFLKAEGVRAFADQSNVNAADSFLQWFNPYVQNEA